MYIFWVKTFFNQLRFLIIFQIPIKILLLFGEILGIERNKDKCAKD